MLVLTVLDQQEMIAPQCSMTLRRRRLRIATLFHSSCWRLVQNCRKFQKAEFAGADQRFRVATLEIWFKSCKMAPFIQVRLDVCRPRNESFAYEYKRELAKSLGELYDSDDPE